MEPASKQTTLATLVTTLASVSEKDLDNIIAVLENVKQRNSGETASSEMKAKHGLKAAMVMKTNNSERGKKTKQASKSGALRRPLNSFMAFRSK